MKKKILIHQWDTTLDYFEYPKIINRIFCHYNFKERKNFVKWIETISNKYHNNFDWWISSPVSRNPFYSNLYKNICILKTLNFLKKNKNLPTLIIVETLGLKKIIEKNFKKADLVIKIKKDKSSYSIFFKKIKAVILYLIQCFLIKFFAKNFQFSNKSLTLIDSFILDENLKEKPYYGSLFRSVKKYKHIFFVPTIIENNIFKFISIIKSLNKSKKFLFKEIILDYKDFFHSTFYLFRKRQLKGKFRSYESYDLSLIINEEIELCQNLYSILLSYNNYKFIHKLKNKNIKIKKSINWFENQSLDKAWNYGFRKYYKNTTLIGYQGFTNYPEYMCLNPTIFEEKCKMIPKQISVINRNYKNLRKEFFPKLNVITGPALRFENLFTKKLIKKRNFDVVVFFEGANKNKDLKILKKIISSSNDLKDVKFYVKPHPSFKNNFENLDIPKNFRVLNSTFSNIAIKTKIAVCYGSTSAIFEALAYGCKIIIPYDNLFDKKNFLHFKISKNLYKICNNEKNLNISLKILLKNLNRSKKSNSIKKLLFNRQTKENIKIFA